MIVDVVGDCFLRKIKRCVIATNDRFFSPREKAVMGERFLSIAQAPSDDARVERDHCSGAKHDDVFHIFDWLISRRQFADSVFSRAATAAAGDMSPHIAPRRGQGCNRQCFLDGIRQAQKAERFSQTGDRAVLV